MSNLNWSTAPIDATHGGNSPYERGVVTWFKDVGHGNHSFLNDGSMQSWHKGSGNLREWILVERPKPWSGPEDGLPPVNERVEVLWSSITGRYVEGLILAHDEGRAVFRFVTGERKGEYQADKLHFSSAARLPNFRAIRTPAQIAADKRETAIRELMDIAQVDCRVTAARLVDAGFKREVK